MQIQGNSEELPTPWELEGTGASLMVLGWGCAVAVTTWHLHMYVLLNFLLIGSYYEYLLKQWLQTGRTERKFLDRYLEAMAGVRKHLIKQTSGPLHLTYVAEMSPSGQSLPKMDHLVCFLPGALVSRKCRTGVLCSLHCPKHEPYLKLVE